MLPVLSERLRAAAALVPEQSVLADVGTDHGYVPVWLCGQGRIRSAIAADINRGPLARAKKHIRRYGMEAYIETRLSDGVAAIAPGEVDAILIAGMGGGLILHILESGEAVCRQAKALVLQPQSEVERVREYLLHAGYVTEAEEMVWEDGKFYPMMRVCPLPEAEGCHLAAGARRDAAMHAEEAEMPGARSCRPAAGAKGDAAIHAKEAEAPDAKRCRLGLRYGELLLARRHPVLRRYLERERQVQTGILERLTSQRGTEQIQTRIREVRETLAVNGEALDLYR